MSINIQLEGGLKKLSGQTMSKDKIIDKLGYTPADKEEVKADIAAVSSSADALKATLEDYIKNHPDIVEDGSGEIIFTDEAGNIIAKFDADGLHTTNIEAYSFISGEDNLIINDLNGNKIFQVDKDGIETTKLKLASGDVDTQLDNLAADIAAVEAKIPEIPVTSVNGKTGDVELAYSDINNAPAIEAEEDDDSLLITDNEGNIAVKAGKIGEDSEGNDIAGIETTEIILKGGKVDERIGSIAADLSAHNAAVNKSDSEDPIHIRPGERAAWNAKATTEYVDEAVAGIIDDAPLATLKKLSTAVGDNENFATEISDEIDKKVATADFVAHRDNEVVHITADERTKWDNKSDVKSYNDLKDAPDISNDDNNLLVTDEAGNIVVKVGNLDDTNKTITGIETTLIKATKAEIDNIYNKTEIDGLVDGVEALVAAKADEVHGHTITAGAEDDNVVILEGTSGTNGVSYKATHATPVANTETDEVYTKVSVDAKGHITSGSIPTTLAGYSISDAYTKEEVNAAVAAVSAEVDAHETNVQTALSALKTELSESITSESKTWQIVDNDGNILLRAGELENNFIGLETTDIKAKTATIENVYNKDEIDAKVAALNEAKADKDHNHDDRYYTEEEVDDKIASALTSALQYKGTKTTTNDLPTSGNVIGDVWNIATACTASESLPKVNAGDNVAWNGEVWDVLAGTVDLSSYSTKSEVGAAIAEVSAEVDAHETAVQTALSELKTELSESITSESKEWQIVDTDGNIVLRAGELEEGFVGLETTAVTANSVVVNGVDIKTKIDSVASDISGIKSGEVVVGKAQHSAAADYASNANHASTADFATNATHATNADFSTNATNATKATQDSDGNVITQTYETKTDANAKMVVDSITVQLGEGGTIGGYKTGDVITNTDIKTILNKLLQKAVPATYTAPKLEITNNGGTGSGNYEYGTNITAKFKAIFTKNDAGALGAISLLKNGAAISSADGTITNSGNETSFEAASQAQLTDTISYSATATYADGIIKTNNLGEASPDGRILAGTATSAKLEYKPYYCGYFYGVLATDSSTALTSDIIRSGSKKSGAYAKGDLPRILASSVANRKRIFVACPATKTGVTKVVMPSAMGADCTADFVKQTSTVTVEGANGYDGIAYNVWVYEPASISDDQTFTVTLG